jgi:predicted transcriptional regulator
MNFVKSRKLLKEMYAVIMEMPDFDPLKDRMRVVYNKMVEEFNNSVRIDEVFCELAECEEDLQTIDQAVSELTKIRKDIVQEIYELYESIN